MHFHSQRMRRLVASDLLPERAGQPVRAWVHISLADLLLLDGDSALQEQWTAQVRERWAACRAFASETGSDGGAWLDGQDAEAIACDAAMAPVVTGDVNVDALEELVRLCVELDRHRRAGGAAAEGPAQPRSARPGRVRGPARPGHRLHHLHRFRRPRHHKYAMITTPRSRATVSYGTAPWGHLVRPAARAGSDQYQ
jgi:hypothetical protein